MKKTIYYLILAIMLLSVIAGASAINGDLQMVSVATSTANPPVKDHDASIRTDVLYNDYSGNMTSITVPIKIELGDGTFVQNDYTLDTGITYTIWNNVVYHTLGTYTLTATIDPNNLYNETNETNNAKSIPVTVQNSVDSVTLANAALTLNQGQSGQTTSTAANNGNTDLYNVAFAVSNLYSGSNVLSNAYITIDPASIPLFYNGASRTLTMTVNVPGAQATGTYTGNVTASYNGLTSRAVLTVTVTQTSSQYSMTVPDVTLGGTSQEREKTVTASLRITNNGLNTLTNLLITSNAVSEYQVTFTPNTIASLAPGAYADVTVSGYIPDDFDSGTRSIGTITVAASQLTKTSTLNMGAESNLEIKNIDITVNDEDTTSMDDGDDIDLKPGDKIKMEIEVKNNFGESIDINDIRVWAENNDLDIDEESDKFDLSDGDKDTVTFDFTIDSNADNDNYDVEITAKGDDENGAEHKDVWTIQFNLEKKSHEITISDVTLSPSTVSCSKTATLRFLLENTGKNDEDKVVVKVKSDDLGLNQVLRDISINEGDDTIKTVTFTVPSTVVNGDYLIDITSYYDTSEESDNNAALLTVTNCVPQQGGQGGQGGQNQNGTIIITPPPTNYVGPVYGIKGFWDSTAGLVIMVAAAILLIVIIILLMVKLVR